MEYAINSAAKPVDIAQRVRGPQEPKSGCWPLADAWLNLAEHKVVIRQVRKLTDQPFVQSKLATTG